MADTETLLHDIHTSKTPIQIQLPTDEVTQSNKEGNLPLQMPKAATKAHIVPTFKKTLVSIPQVVDAGYAAYFNKDAVYIINNTTKQVEWKGTRNKQTKLWELPLKDDINHNKLTENFQHRIQQVNNASIAPTLKEHIKFLHQACGSPVKSTWIKAINNNHFKSWPNLTAKNVNKHLETTIHTLRGHMAQTRKNKGKQKKTKIKTEKEKETTKDIEKDSFPNPSKQQTNFCFTKIIDITGFTAMDLAGKFPITSSRGNKYIFLWYDYDGNSIKSVPIKSREKEEQIRAYNICYEYYSLRGFVPQVIRLDNEASNALKSKIRGNNMEFQLVPPSIHRQNSAERAMRTYKEHFLSAVSTFDASCPMSLWCQFCEAIDVQLNLLRASRLHPQLSAQCHLNGEFDYSKTPMVPLGTKAIIFIPTKDRKTWDFHALEGYYLGPALDHYKCHRIHIQKTRSERISDTVQFLPTHSKMPYASSLDEAIQAIKHLVSAISNAQPTSPFSLKDK